MGILPVKGGVIRQPSRNGILWDGLFNPSNKDGPRISSLSQLNFDNSKFIVDYIRHGGNCNIMYADGHVLRVPRQAILPISYNTSTGQLIY
jgi:prepilin-type processing-associated H-X9-DG protein